MIDISKDELLCTLFGSIRKIISLLLTLVFCVLCFRGDISTDQFIPIFSMILGYYFGTSTTLENKSNNIQSSKSKNI